jgi:mono/diheme cytochrome c family protein
MRDSPAVPSLQPFRARFPFRGVSLYLQPFFRTGGCLLKKKSSNKEVFKNTALVLLALLFFVFALWAQKDEPPAKASENKTSQEAGAKGNPVKPTAESIAKGKKRYGFDCEMCHGKNGDGKGDMASDMKNVTDFTNPDALKNRTDSELFNVIRKGKGEMPAEGERGKDDDIWNMVNYIRSLAKKQE